MEIMQNHNSQFSPVRRGGILNSKLYPLLFSILLSPLSLMFPQSYSGTVQDALTSEFISDAEVIIFYEGSNRKDTVFTDQFGKWEYSYDPTSVHPDPWNASSNIPSDSYTHNVTDFILMQNYPNPYNPSTLISFSVLKSDDIQLIVHDITGSEIDRVKCTLSPGEYSITWNGSGAAGVYFYTIRNSKASITKKMIQLDGGNASGFGPIHSFSQSSIHKSNSSSLLSSLDLTIITSAFAYVSDTLQVSVSGGEEFNVFLNTIHHSAFLADLHNDILEKMLYQTDYHLKDYHTYNHTDIPRMKIGGVDLEMFVVWVDPSVGEANFFETAIDMMNIFDSEVFVNTNDLIHIKSKSQIPQITSTGKIGGVLCVEGGHAIENDLTKLNTLYDRGMRYMTITWNNSTDWAISASDSRSTTVGLSEFGREVIRTLDSLGILIDVAHTGIQTIKDILEVTTNPIIDTHAGVRALRDHSRNLYDYQIQDIANSGGVIGVVFYPPFLGSNSNSVDIQTVVNHINYIRDLVGIDHVALGSDFDGIGTNTVNGLEDISKYPDLTIKLLENGYTRNEIEKILGKNFLRVFNQVCK